MRRVSEDAFLLTWSDEDERVANGRARAAAASLSPLPGVVDLVPAARSLLITVVGEVDEEHLRVVERDAAPAPVVLGNVSGVRSERHEIAVSPDGIDLPEILERTRLPREALLARLEEVTFTVGFLGFAPGFAYLYGLPPALHVPRRATPRTSVPRGSVAIGGGYVGIYPAAMPGGWNLVGRADLPLFDATREPPVLLRPDDTVRFRFEGS